MSITDLEREIDRLETEIDATPPGHKRETLEALHEELLDDFAHRIFWNDSPFATGKEVA